MIDQRLVRHFLQRFFDNDLISPDADRGGTLAHVAAALISSSLFVTVFLSLKFVAMPFQSPGRTAVIALNDWFLYNAWSMNVMALAAVSTWDALSLDYRDTAILGPLPIPRPVIVRAKAAAVMTFGLGCAVAVNGASAVLHPLLMVAQLPVGVLAVAGLVVVHAAVVLAAGLFGFLSVIATRELCRAMFGIRRFAHVETIVRTALIVVIVAAMLLLPGLSRAIVRSELRTPTAASYLIPAMWFVGLQDTLAGDLAAGLPRGDLPPRVASIEDTAMALYRSHELHRQSLGIVALGALGLVGFMASALFAWNNRRLPLPPAGHVGRLGVGILASRLGRIMLAVRHPEAQAGFFFTLQSLARSLPHRVSVATALAVGLAMVIVSMRNIDPAGVSAAAAVPLAVLAAQTVLLSALLLGVRHAVRVPAELRANWMVRLSWSGDERPYLGGVKRAAVASVGLLTLLALFPVHVLTMGRSLALVHGATGFLLLAVLVEGLFLGFRKLPFACRYVPADAVKKVLPVYVVLFVAATYGFAAVERLALSSTAGAARLLLGLSGLFLLLRAADWALRRRDAVIELDAPPDLPTQRLPLSESG